MGSVIGTCRISLVVDEFLRKWIPFYRHKSYLMVETSKLAALEENHMKLMCLASLIERERDSDAGSSNYSKLPAREVYQVLGHLLPPKCSREDQVFGTSMPEPELDFESGHPLPPIPDGYHRYDFGWDSPSCDFLLPKIHGSQRQPPLDPVERRRQILSTIELYRLMPGDY